MIKIKFIFSNGFALFEFLDLLESGTACSPIHVCIWQQQREQHSSHAQTSSSSSWVFYMFSHFLFHVFLLPPLFTLLLIISHLTSHHLLLSLVHPLNFLSRQGLQQRLKTFNISCIDTVVVILRYWRYTAMVD